MILKYFIYYLYIYFSEKKKKKEERDEVKSGNVTPIVSVFSKSCCFTRNEYVSVCLKIRDYVRT